MSTNDVKTAIIDAFSALEAQPELERRIKQLEEDLSYARLELEEANGTISRLRDENYAKEVKIHDLVDQQRSLNSEILDLRSRNTWLDGSLGDANASIRDLTQAKADATIMIELLEADKRDLEARLEDSKGYAARLADMLKNIGQSIATAVSEPVVSEDKPFLVGDSVGLPVQTQPSVDSSGDNVVAEPTTSVVVAQEMEQAEASQGRPWWADR